jgi:hypothetical protein
MSPGRIAVIALVLVVIGGAWAVVALTGENRSAPDALLLEPARPEDPAWEILAEDDDTSGGPDSTGDRTAGDGGTSGGDTSVPAAVGGGGGDSSAGFDA